MALNQNQIASLKRSARLISADPHLQIAESWVEWANANIDRIESKGAQPLIHAGRIMPIIWILKEVFGVPGRIVFNLMKDQLELQVKRMHAQKASHIDLESTSTAFNDLCGELQPIRRIKWETN